MEILMEQPLLDKRGIYAGARHSAQERRIDLFGAETGFALAEITTLLYERLDPFLCHRARSLVFERILLPYLDGDTDRRDWEDGKTNWTAVCAGSVGAAALYLIEEPMLLGRIVRRVMDSMENFLEGYGEDGACLEGLSYWNYGFGYFVFFADLLRSRTGGKIDLLNGPQKEKIRRIMTFQQKCFLDGRKAVSFSDAPRENWYAPGLTCYLRRLNPEVAVLPAECMANFGDDGCHRWASDLRNLIWADPVQPDSVDRTESFECLECAQWAILWRDGFSFACKGGHNGEPHNHNDVGSFLLCADKDTFLEDIGVGMHSRQYFGEERYSFLTASSRGHSVPVIDGGYQKEGEEHRASFFTAEYDGEEARIRMEIGGAYGTENIRQIRRSFLADGKNRRLTVTDTFSFESRPKSLTERFMTGIKPEAGPGEVRLKGKKGMACLHYEEKEWELSLSKEVYKPSREEERTVWCVDFTARHPERECEFCLCAEILPL